MMAMWWHLANVQVKGPISYSYYILRLHKVYTIGRNVDI